MSLITLEQAKAHIEMDQDLSDDMIEEKIIEASAIVLDFLKVPADTWQNTSGEPAAVPPVVVAATKLVIAALFENREGSEDDPQPLSKAVKDLLRRSRDPALA